MNVLLATYSYIAALVGAGFASGQEILSFFVVHGKIGIAGIFLSSVIFGYFAYFILDISRRLEVFEYNTLISKAFTGFGKRFVDILTFVFTCVVYCVMVACSGEMLHLLWGFKTVWGSILMSFICAAILLTENNGALKINGILGGIIAVGICVCTLYMLRYREHQTFLNEAKPIVAGATYAGYNLLGSGFTLVGLSSEIKSRREAVYVGALSAFAVFVMTSLIWALLLLYHKHIALGEIPLLTMALRQNGVIVFIYSIILILAVLTTAISSGFGVLDMSQKYIDRKKCAILLAIGGICSSQIGFSSLINIVYRACGYIGIFVVMALIYNLNYKNKKNVINKR